MYIILFAGLRSRAFHHASPNLSSFVSLSPKSLVSVVTPDGTPMSIVGIGSIDAHFLPLNDIYHIPSLTLNFVFVSQLCESGYLVFLLLLVMCEIHNLRS